MFLTPGLSYAELAADSVVKLIYGTPVHVASIETLIRLKRSVEPLRPKDVHDIAELEKLRDGTS